MHGNTICSEVVLTGFANDRFIFNSTSFFTLKVYSTAGSCTRKFKLVYGCLKCFFTLSLRNDLLVCGSPNLIELCYSLVYSKQFNV